MLRIGDFSKFSRVSIKTLRYYDEIDLLKPVEVDKFSGYRYYSVDQLAKLNRIIGLRELGLSLGGRSELYPHLAGQRAQFAGPPMAIYHDAEYRGKDVDIELAMPISGTIPETEKIKAKVLPEIEQAAYLIHQGAYEDFHLAYKALMAWVEANGYKIGGANREVYLRGPGEGGEDDPAHYVTEIQLPVKKERGENDGQN